MEADKFDHLDLRESFNFGRVNEAKEQGDQGTSLSSTQKIPRSKASKFIERTYTSNDLTRSIASARDNTFESTDIIADTDFKTLIQGDNDIDSFLQLEKQVQDECLKEHKVDEGDLDGYLDHIGTNKTDRMENMAKLNLINMINNNIASKQPCSTKSDSTPEDAKQSYNSIRDKYTVEEVPRLNSDRQDGSDMKKNQKTMERFGMKI